MKVDLEIVCGFIGAGKTAFINSLERLTGIEDDNTLLIITEQGNGKIDTNLNSKCIFFNDDICKLSQEIIKCISKYKPYKIIIEYNGTYTMDDFYDIYRKELIKYCKLKCTYYIANAANFIYYFRNLSELFTPYIENSNFILINNSSNVTPEVKKEIYKIISSINYNGHILFSNNNNNILTVLEESNLFLSNRYRKLKLNFLKKLNQ